MFDLAFLPPLLFGSKCSAVQRRSSACDGKRGQAPTPIRSRYGGLDRCRIRTRGIEMAARNSRHGSLGQPSLHALEKIFSTQVNLPVQLAHGHCALIPASLSSLPMDGPSALTISSIRS